MEYLMHVMHRYRNLAAFNDTIADFKLLILNNIEHSRNKIKKTHNKHVTHL